MNVACPSCATVFRVDPRKVPARGVRARCSECASAFAVPSSAPGDGPGADRDPADSAPRAPAPQPTPLDAADPAARARRLARALVSDIAAYQPDRLADSLSHGTLRQDFREEIERAWAEYSAAVGDGLARETPHFREALNEILAGGATLF